MPTKRTIPTDCAFCGTSFLAAALGHQPPQKFCSQSCAKASLVIPLDVKFWAGVQKGPGCWEWTKARMPFGYGQINDRGKVLYAHRVSWEIHNGPIPKGLHVCHHCDNPPCVRPDHLFLGTARDNINDALHKGRMDLHGIVSHIGAAHPAAILSETKVRAIRARHDEPHKDLAAEFGVSRPTITAILNRRIWKHI